MDELQDYSSDSETNEVFSVKCNENHSTEVDVSAEVMGFPALSPTIYPANRKRKANEFPSMPLDGSGATDYFHLSSSGSEEENSMTNLGCIHNSQNAEPTKIKFKDVPVPKQPLLSFWNDDIKIPTLRHAETKSIQKTGNLNVASCTLSDSIVKPYVHRNNRHGRVTVEGEQLSMKQSQTRKLSCFKVHAEVAPSLHSDSFCFHVPIKVIKTLTGHTGAINKIEWCVPQFSHIIASGSMDNKVNLWNIFQEQNNCIKSYTYHKKAVTDVTWSETGKNLLTCSYDKTAVVTDVETGTNLAVCGHQNFVTVGRYHPVKYNYFVTGTLDKLFCWDTRNTVKPAKTYVYKDKFGQVKDLVFSKDGSQMFTCNDLVSRDSADKNIMAWDFNKHVVISNQIYQERFTCTRLKVHPMKEEFLALSQGGYIAQFSSHRPYKMNKCKRFDFQKVMGYNIGFDISPDGKCVVSGSAEGNVYMYNYSNTKTMHKINLGERTVCLDVDCHPVFNSTVAVGTWDGGLHILR